MTLVLFFIILAVLILSHELGHFLAAKYFGVRVDEFGLGFPPKLVSWRRGETEYSINLIPFGGFVKIFGETPDEDSLTGADSGRSLVNKPRWQQAVVLAAGVFFNLILAWGLISVGLMVGLPSPAEEATGAPARLLITSVMPDSPAAAAGLRPGDELVALGAAAVRTTGQLTPELVQDFVADHPTEEITLEYRRGQVLTGKDLPVARAELTPRPIQAGAAPVLGIAMEEIALRQVLPHRAIVEGLNLTVSLTKATAAALASFVTQAWRGESIISSVTGPVGLVGLVGNARVMGLVYLLSFTALISINLAVINLVPFPALDGGRLLFLLIEKIKGSAIRPTVANVLNGVGFALLLLLMAVITFHDIAKLF